MKKEKSVMKDSIILCLIFVFGFIQTANATLIDRGGGLIYDDVLDITWLQDANFAQTSGYDSDGQMTWDIAVAWAYELEYYDSVRDVTWKDWRLPTTADGPTTYNDNVSEMGHLFHESLGNLSYYDIDGNYQPDWGLNNPGPFINIQTEYYWSSTEWSTNPTWAWKFRFLDGGVTADIKSNRYNAWVVRDGDVAAAVPESDTDGDGIPDDADNCPLVSNLDQVDSDGDGSGDLCDACELDADNDIDDDGICGDVDNCPTDNNPSQANFDDDVLGNVCDLDDDNDGFDDTPDNCPFDANPGQIDTDGDGFGNVCDLDDDNDGVIDGGDACYETPLGEIIDETGCSIAELCVCGNEWKNHGAYVKCVAHTSEDFVADGLISEIDKDYIVSEAGSSECGHKN
ncbi:thrombospondin type 3 repeat-containing protein [Candidatus Pacearchaeota archaeon]|nr:thrombospondin type 3 repeat-containing protein [Candidatus Pacearchaeota archaeon]